MMIHSHLKLVDIQAKKFQSYQLVWRVQRKKSQMNPNLKKLLNNLKRRKRPHYNEYTELAIEAGHSQPGAPSENNYSIKTSFVETNN